MVGCHANGPFPMRDGTNGAGEGGGDTSGMTLYYIPSM